MIKINENGVVKKDDILLMADKLGIAGKPLCVHSSFRSFGKVEGGPGMIIDALLEKGCTVMVPTFSYFFGVPAPGDQRIERNGMDYESQAASDLSGGKCFSPDSNEISRESMGAIPSVLVSTKGRIRGNHPLNSFSALGPLAHELISCQTFTDVYAPIKELCNHDGYIVLMGVGLTSLTAIHLAENMAGRNLFVKWAKDQNGNIVQVRVGSCSRGFDKLEPFLSSLATYGIVGRSKWTVFPAKPLLEAAAKAIRENPMITHCGNEDCIRCRDAVQGGPILPG